MEKLTYEEIRKNHKFLDWVFIHSMVFKDAVKTIRTEDDNYNFQFIVNGIELPIIQTFADLDKQLDRMVNEKAMELIEEKFSVLHELVSDLSNAATQTFRDKLGVYLDD
jgi:hypothetical protein